MYSAVVLDSTSRYRLQDRFMEFLRINHFGFRVVIQDWKFICHHMTMNFGDVPDRDFRSEEEDLPITLTTDAFGFYRNQVCAVRINDFRALSSNETPHITVALNKHGKPVQSNLIEDWKPFRKMELMGTIQIID